MKQTYETLHEEQEQGNDHLDLAMHLHFQMERDVQRYNLLQINEITFVLFGDGKAPNAFRDIMICLRRGALQCINECHPSYLLLHKCFAFFLW
jgi:hypothetical protein